MNARERNIMNVIYRGLDGRKPVRTPNARERAVLDALLSGKEVPLEDGMLAECCSWYLTKHWPCWCVIDDDAMTYIAANDDFGVESAFAMWAYTILLWRAEMGRPVALEDLTGHLLRDGFPTSEALRCAWLQQRVMREGRLCNLLEDRSLWLALVDRIRHPVV